MYFRGPHSVYNATLNSKFDSIYELHFKSYIFPPSCMFYNTYLFIQMTLTILEKLLANIFELLKCKTNHMYVIW